ncbi:MFS transporter [Leuconostoc mesenteroides]
MYRILTINLISRLSYSMIFPFIALYYADQFNNQLVGIFLALSTIMQLLSTFLVGFLSKIMHNTKIMKIGEFLKLILYGILLVSNNRWLFVIIIVLISTIQGFIVPAMMVVLINSSKIDKSKVLSINYWINNISIIFGTIIGSILYSDNNLILKTIMVISSLILVFITLSIHKKNSSLSIDEHKPTVIESYNHVIKDKNFIYFFIGSIFIIFLESQISSYILIHFPTMFHSNLYNLNISKSIMFAIINTINGSLVVIILPILIIFLKPNRYILSISICLFTIGIAGMSIGSNSFWIISMSLIYSIGEILFISPSQEIFGNIISNEHKQEYISVNSITTQIGQLLSSLILVGSNVFTPNSYVLLILCIGIFAIICFKKSSNHQIRSTFN